MHRRYTKSGFTIVELLIVIVVIAILAAIAVLGYGSLRNRAEVSVIKSEAGSITKQLKIE